MALPTLHGEARIVGSPDLRFTPSGQAVLNVRLVANRRRLNEQTNQWEDAGACWLNGSLWGKSAENAADFLADKDVVLYSGQLETREYERDGQKRTSVDVRLASIAKVPPRDSSSTPTSQQGSSAAGNDPWASQGDEPPF